MADEVKDDIIDVISDEKDTISDEKFEDSEQKRLGFVKRAMQLVTGNKDEVREAALAAERGDSDELSEQDDTEDTSQDGTEETAERLEGSGQEEATDQDSEEQEVQDGRDDTQELTIDKIDERLVKAARRRGWGDEKILKYAEQDISILEDVAVLVDNADRTYEKPAPQDNTETQEEQQSGLKKVEVSDEKAAELTEKYGEGIMDDVVNPLINANNELIERVNALDGKESERDKKVRQAKLAAQGTVFMDSLDKASKDYPELGQWENVPKPANGKLDFTNPIVKLRGEIFPVFESFIGLGHTPESAAENALLWYKGRSGPEKIEKKVIEKLNDRKKKFTNRPGQRKVKPVFESADDKKRNVVQEAMKAANIQTE